VLVAAAFVPGAPVLIPQVASGAAGELDEARAAALDAIRNALQDDPETVLLVAGGPPRRWPADPPSFARLGLPDPRADSRPVALHVGRWLLDAAGWEGPVLVETTDGTTAPDLHGQSRVAVLAPADGSARRSPAAPGHFHGDAEAYDDTVVRAVAAADVGALLALDPADDARLLVGGRPAWQATARAAQQEAGASWRGELLWSGAPYGVGYLVATWRR
jgi:hypothetical protein